MIVWINGTFGVGKTTTSTRLHDLTGWPLFDPEHVGYLVGGNLRDLDFDDFQDLPPWRALVPRVADELVRFRGAEHLVAVQTVLRHDYWDEIVAGFTALGHEVFHVVLDCDPDALRARIRADQEEAGALEWRLDHVDRYVSARADWMLAAADLPIDTTHTAPPEIAAAIGAAVRSPRAR